jgi:hypothetical protein
MYQRPKPGTKRWWDETRKSVHEYVEKEREERRAKELSKGKTAMEFYKPVSRERRLNQFEAEKLLELFIREHGLIGWGGVVGYIEGDTGGEAFIRRNGSKVICINSETVKACTPAQIKDVILHEIAHAIVGVGHHHRHGGHGVAWAKKAREIGVRPSAIIQDLHAVGNYSLSRKYMYWQDPYWRTHRIPNMI